MEEFSSIESTLCADSYSVSIPPTVLLQWHVKDPDHSAKSANGMLHLNMHVYTLDPSKSEWADYTAVQAECGNLSGNELTWGMNCQTFSQNPCTRGKSHHHTPHPCTGMCMLKIQRQWGKCCPGHSQDLQI